MKEVVTVLGAFLCALGTIAFPGSLAIAQTEVGRHCSCDPPRMLRPPGFDCMSHCGGDVILPPPPPTPLPPRTVKFESISFIGQCDTLEFNQDDDLRRLLGRLRDDAFADALKTYIRDLSDAADTLHGLRAELQPYNSDCISVTDDARGFGGDARAWNRSDCVGGVSEDEGARCASRQADLRSRKSTLQDRYAAVSAASDRLNDAFSRTSAKAERAVRNANVILDPANIEQVLRLYMWHVIEERAQDESCRAFATIAKALSKRVANQKLFIDYLVRNTVERLRWSVTLFTGPGSAAPAFASSGKTFNSSGFKAKFINKIGQDKNLVRHTAVHMYSGYKLPAGITATKLISYFRDILMQEYKENGEYKGNVPENGDWYLALAAGQLGYRLGHGLLRTAEFGDAMTIQLCGY